MDSSSVTVLVQARGSLTSDGGSLTLRNPSIAAHRIVTVSGAEELLDDGQNASDQSVQQRDVR
jgi:anti-anti-sigma regulatory factor